MLTALLLGGINLNNDYDSRSGYRAKRKKTNLILNSLIVIVVVLIVFVAYKIFASGDDSASPKKDVQHTAEKQTEQKKDQNETAKETSTAAENDTGSTDTSTDGSTVEDQQNSDDTSTEGSDDSKVEDDGSTADEKTTENKDWEPVGTTQTGEHTPVYDTSSTDWQEMLNAISSATGLDQDNMIVWHLGRDRSKQNASVGTVSSKDKKQNYTVYIEWVDGQGWKPTKVEEK
ncbi:YrrS family protein [Neobacillus cucumis]|nr:YrrS family protein [Neobacillus cucumis]